jgi:glutamine synthetase
VDSGGTIPEAGATAGVPHALSNGASPMHALGFEEARRSGALREVEIAYTDHQGQLLGKRLPTAYLADGGLRSGFCSAALAWDHLGEILPGTSLTGPDSGYPDAFMAPDLETFRWLPWREGAGQILCDVVDREDRLLPVAPRSVLRHMVDRLKALGCTARIGLETEFYVLRADGTLADVGVHCYSLVNANRFEPFTSELAAALPGMVEYECVNTEQGPGQFEVNLANQDPLGAADDAARLRYAIREIARRNDLRATFMAKPYAGISGSSSHVHVSLWRDDAPAFGAEGSEPNALMHHALGGLIEHLPAIALFGAPTVNSYKRYEPDAFAPVSVSWSDDNRTVAIRSLLRAGATRIELRTPAADANPYWAVSSVLAAVVAGIEDGADPGARSVGYTFAAGPPLPRTLGDAIAATRADRRIGELLGQAAVDDVIVTAEAEWRAFTTQVTDWDRDRYLDTV